ncbi:MAG: BatD family protein [Magnetococcales bacterium]|nr:BatD family protein [Magnetococcales bacterium]
MTDPKRLWVWAIGCLWLILAGAAWGANPEAELRLAEGPYYADAPVDLMVVVKGFEETPEPKVQFDPPPWGRLDFVGMSPEVSSSIQIINGQYSQWKSVRFSFHYRFNGDKTGKVTLGPFRVTQDGHAVTTRSVTLDLGVVPTGGDQRILLQVPEEPVYVGQRVPIRLQWWIQEDLVERVVAHEIRVPLFDMVEPFAFEESDQSGQKNAMVIQLSGGAKKFPAETTKGKWEGRSWLVLTLDRVLIPLKSGEYAIPASSVILEEGTSWQRSFFGERTPTQVRRLRGVDSPRSLHVRPLPEAGQPASFSGAIGQNFSLAVEADRSVVQVGDPIRLTLTLKGDGPLSTVSLPALTRDLPPGDFRIPEGDVAGMVADGAKKFEVMVRVLREGVREIPPITYSWFDPQKGQYETTRSRPIALSVGAAKVVSAQDVVRGQGEGEKHDAPPLVAASSQPTPSPHPPGTVPSGGGDRVNSGESPRDDSATRVDADLAVERDVDVLLGQSGTAWLSRLLVWLGYLGGLGLLGYAAWWKRRSKVDPEKTRRQKILRGLMHELEEAKSPQTLANLLRRMAAMVADVPRQELDNVLENLDNQAYAPRGDTKMVEAELKARVVELAKRLLVGES